MNAEITVKEDPFKYCTMQNFLDPRQAKELKQEILKLPFTHKKSDLFEFLQSDNLSGDNTPQIIQEIKKQLLDEQWLQKLEQSMGITITRNKIDLHATNYQDTHFLLPHDDQLDERVFAFLIYLTDMKQGQGGALRLYNQEDNTPTAVAESITPQMNLFGGFVVSEISFHDVQEVIGDNDRIAFGGWYYGHQ